MRKISHFELKEPFLEKVLQTLRFNKVSRHINNNSIVLDLGCGYNGTLLRFLSKKISDGYGMDISISKKRVDKKIQLVRGKVDGHIPFKKQQIDYITALAIIEHVENVEIMLAEIFRVLKKNGVLLLTTPSRYSKPILEFLASRLKIISGEEIEDHKRYYDKVSLKNDLIKAGFKEKNIKVDYFQFGLNIFAKAIK